jgi:catechol 2,3-dioxygenase-like lactoylglutathione lyase family enzyme
MNHGVETVGLFVRDQQEALDFYVDHVGFVVEANVRNGPFWWLTLRYPGQSTFQLGLMKAGPPVHDEETAKAIEALLAKGALASLVLAVPDCRGLYERLKAAGVDMTQEPVSRFGTVDAGFRDPSGNGWKIIERAAR